MDKYRELANIFSSLWIEIVQSGDESKRLSFRRELDAELYALPDNIHISILNEMADILNQQDRVRHQGFIFSFSASVRLNELRTFGYIPKK